MPRESDGWLWISTEKMTGAVRVEGQKIVEAPPILQVFIGQSVENLRTWLSKQPGFREVSIPRVMNVREAADFYQGKKFDRENKPDLESDVRWE